MNDYANSAKYYDFVHSLILPHELRFYMKYIKRRMTILDVGCGTGRITVPLAGMTSGCCFNCIDNSEAMLGVFREKKAKIDKTFNYGETIQIIQADMRSYNTDTRYNLIMFPFQSIQTISSKKGIVECIDRMKKLLAPKGLMIITAFNPSIGFLSDCREKLNGDGSDERNVYLAFTEKMKIVGDTYSFTEKIKVFEKEHGFLLDETMDDFEICSLDYNFVLSLEQKSAMRLLGIYGDYDFYPCHQECRDIIAVFRNDN
jgi:SAM-dependent methyltransferase